MIRQGVTRHGLVYPLAPPSSFRALQLDPATIGVIKEGPVRKWKAKKELWETKYASQKRHVQKQRAKEYAAGYANFGPGETPPPTALAGRRTKTMERLHGAGKSKKRGKSWGLAMWAGWGSKHDEVALEKVEDAKRGRGNSTSSAGRSRSRGASMASKKTMRPDNMDRVRSDAGLRSPTPDTETVTTQSPAAVVADAADLTTSDQHNLPASTGLAQVTSQALPTGTKVPGSENTFLAPTSTRPHNGEVAYPFKLRSDLRDARSASTFTLDSRADGVSPPRSRVPSTTLTAALDRAAGQGEETRLGTVASEVRDTDPVGNGIEVNPKAVGTVGAPTRPPLESFVTAHEF